jgi:hypothetical protein
LRLLESERDDLRAFRNQRLIRDIFESGQPLAGYVP